MSPTTLWLLQFDSGTEVGCQDRARAAHCNGNRTSSWDFQRSSGVRSDPRTSEISEVKAQDNLSRRAPGAWVSPHWAGADILCLLSKYTKTSPGVTGSLGHTSWSSQGCMAPGRKRRGVSSPVLGGLPVLSENLNFLDALGQRRGYQ